MNKWLRLTALSLFVSLSALYAQGTLTGVVLDSAKADPLIGANVYLVGTALGSVTDIEGKYRIVNVPEGSYTLR
ncbi:MAG TPA: carboxypeptidase-like regulatory domain-containing protein, partial [bacterium]|nr:carboxypeptidase-like regulatory domain-containing protein [bacterium]